MWQSYYDGIFEKRQWREYGSFVFPTPPYDTVRDFSPKYGTELRDKKKKKVIQPIFELYSETKRTS